MEARLIHILLLEDYAAYARVLEEALDDAAPGAFRLTCVPDLANALACLSRLSFDLILVDLGVTDSSGLMTLRRVVEKARGVPTIVLTGVDDEAVGEAAVKAGADDYLVKTQTGGRRLWRVIRYSIERHRLRLEHNEAERLRILCETAGAAAHEINQPLTAIIGFSDLILKSLGEDHRLKRDLERIQQAGLTIQGIVKQMQNVKQYVTKAYLGGIDIVDFGAASGKLGKKES
jgi:two-component system, NarL family, sensor histidine kinase UhpB